jgi:SAM-dependent methyltransferase
MTTAPFDLIAPRYDELWTDSPIGRLQREAVWRRLDALFPPGAAILDIGCGTGADALHLTRSGRRVTAIDSSAEMVRIARSRGVHALHLPIEDLAQLNATYDGVLSNFGALNCIADLPRFAASLAPLVRPHGRLALCLMGRFCLRETLHYAARLQPSRAFRRLPGASSSSTFGLSVSYPTVRQLAAALRPSFHLLDWRGIGLFVPPSYVYRHSPATLRRFAALDRALAHLPLFRALADHRLLVFEKV